MSSLIESFQRHVLSWEFSKLREGVDQIAKPPKSKDDLFLATYLKSSSSVMIPDRFLDIAAYQSAFFRPALYEFQAAVTQALPMETAKRGMAVKITVDRQQALPSSSDSLPDLVTLTCVFDVRLDQPVSEQLVLLSDCPTPVAGGVVVLALTTTPRLSPTSLRLKASAAAVARLRAKTDGRWFLLPLYPMTSVGRELQALSDVAFSRAPLLEEILLGSSDASTPFTTTVTTTAGSSSNSSSHGSSPGSVVHPQLYQYLSSRLNSSQLSVISAITDPGKKFILVQGPPGCGKSHTIHHAANVLHYLQYQAYYEAVAERLERKQLGDTERDWLDLVSLKPRLLLCAQSNVAVDNMLERLVDLGFRDAQGRRYVPQLVRVGRGATTPTTTPTTTATTTSTTNTTTSSSSRSTTKYSLDSQVEKVLSLSGVELHDKLSKHQAKLNALRLNVLDARAKLLCLALGTPYVMPPGVETRVVAVGNEYKAYWVDHNKKITLDKLPAASTVGSRSNGSRWGVREMPEWQLFVSELMRELELWERTYWKVQRLKLAKSSSSGSSSYGEYQRLRENMETLILNRASVVLGTLNSCGQTQVRNSQGFQALIVDEACQAVELSTLIPLASLGVKKCVLVGDPQQLPATVLGKREELGNYERSLFERLQMCGVNKIILNVQYRMHPGISLFPRLVFYSGHNSSMSSSNLGSGSSGSSSISGLEDGPNVINYKPYFSKPEYRMQPFTFYDLAEGRERGGLQGSRSNLEEADFVVNLYMTLWQIGLMEGQDLSGRVGIITPYQDQVKLIRQELDRAFVDLSIWSNEVEVNTVDAYQGREKDIIILSTVRASENNTIGFLADLRRMNVAITRAKLGLFVVGKASSLGVDEIWKLLIDQSQAIEGGFVRVPDPLCDLFEVYRRLGARGLPAVKGGVVVEYIKELRKAQSVSTLRT